MGKCHALFPSHRALEGSGKSPAKDTEMVESDLEGKDLPKIDSEMKQPWELHQHSAAEIC